MSQEILVPVDLSQEEATLLTMPYAVEMAQLRNATLRLVTVLPGFIGPMVPYLPNDAIEKGCADAENKLKDVGGKHIPANVTWNAKAIAGQMPRTLIDEINETRPAMVVMASHNPTWTDYFIGSVADQVVRRVYSPVLVVRDPNGAR